MNSLLTISSPFQFLHFFVFLLFIDCSEGTIQLPQNVSIPALFAFGDSIVDQGNNNGILTIGKCNFPPYGKDFPGGVPTGRFCNGKTPPDLIADEIGIAKVIPAYLDPNLKPEDLLKGVSFAYGGCGYDPLTSQFANVITLTDQLGLFREYIAKLKGLVGEERTNFIIENSLYLVVAGTNDLLNTYFTSGIRRTEYDLPSYADFIVSSASDFVQELITFGARRIGVFSVPTVGCLPSQRTLAGGVGRMCVEERNQAAQLFNNKLSTELNSLGQKIPQSRIVYIDIYNPLLNLIQQPKTYGFEVTDRGCCGTGNIEVSVLCNKFTQVCADDTKFIFWDSFHPTEKGYRVLIHQVLENCISSFF